MRLHWNAIGPVALSLILMAAIPVAAQGPSLPGTYTYLEAESDPVRPAIEQAVARMNFITRPIARGRLVRTNVPYQTITIRRDGDQVTVITDDRAPIVATADGNPMKWTREDGELVRVGITDFAQDALGDIVYVSLPQVGDQVTAGETCGELESTKSVSDIYAPVTGEVVATNQALDSTPELVNSDPYEAGWLFEVSVSDATQVDGLMDAAAYQAGLDG